MEESKCGIWKDGNECSWRVQDKDYHFRILIRICDRLSTLLWYLYSSYRENVPNVLIYRWNRTILPQRNHWIVKLIEKLSDSNWNRTYLHPRLIRHQFFSIYRSIFRLIILRRTNIFMEYIYLKMHKNIDNVWHW